MRIMSPAAALPAVKALGANHVCLDQADPRVIKIAKSLPWYGPAHSPHDVGQFFSMKSTLESHSPARAQAGQSDKVSYATRSHWPHACGHVRSMRYGFVSHSPSAAQAPHDGSRSVQ